MMGFLLAVLSFVVAEEVVELEPVAASGTGIHSSANIVCSALTSANCESYAGCIWHGDGDACRSDPCFKWDTSTNVPDSVFSDIGIQVTCKGFPALSTSPSTGGSCTGPCSGNIWTNGFPAQYCSGSGSDFYAQKTTKTVLNQCEYKYLANGTCNDVPWCILVDAPVPAAGKVCKLLPQCETAFSGNFIKVPNASICSCLNERLQNGDTTACDQNPGCYKNTATTPQCVVDTCYAYNIQDTENPDCSGAIVPSNSPTGTTCTVATVFDKQGTDGQVSIPVCVASNGNTTPNKCWKLTEPVIKPIGSTQCPVNPSVSSDGWDESKTDKYCKGDCQVVSVSTYYYGAKKICVDAEHLPEGGSSIIRIPSIVGFLLVAALLSML